MDKKSSISDYAKSLYPSATTYPKVGSSTSWPTTGIPTPVSPPVQINTTPKLDGEVLMQLTRIANALEAIVERFC